MYTIRKATPEDTLGITIVTGYSWQTAYKGLLPEEQINRLVDDLLPRTEKTRLRMEQGGLYVVAVDGNTIVGYCRFGACRDEEYAGEGEAYALYVLPGYQKMGVGKALLLTACETLRATGYTTVIVNVLKGNSALEFYRKQGGTVIGHWADDQSGFPMEGETLRFSL